MLIRCSVLMFFIKKWFQNQLLIKLVFIALALVLICKNDFTVNASDSWFNSSWDYRKQITIDNSLQTETLSDFPLLVQLNSSNFDFSKAKTNGEDIRFVTLSGLVLSYEIEKWDDANDLASIWVKIPSLLGSSDSQYIYMYYGNSAATDSQSVNSVWDSNFKLISHLNDTLTPPTRQALTIEPISIKGDSTRLFIGGQNHDGLKVLDKDSYAVLKSLNTTENVERLYVKDNYLAFTAEGNKGYVYDLDTDTYVNTITATALLRSVYIDENNVVYFGESDTGDIYYADIGVAGQNSVSIGEDDIREISSNGNDLIVACNDNKTYLVNKTTLITSTIFTDSTNSVEVAQIDDNYIWFASDQQKVWIKNRNSPYSTIAVLHGPINDVTSVDYDDGYWFVSSDDGNVYIYSGSTYNLVSRIDGGNGSGAEELWLDKQNNNLYFVRGHITSGTSEKSLYKYNYPSSSITYMEQEDSTSNQNTLVATESASLVSSKIANGISFNGSNSYLEQKRLFNSGWRNGYISSFDNQAFLYAFGANLSSILGDGLQNNYFLRYANSSTFESGYVGAAGTGEAVTNTLTNRDFESGFTSGVGTGWGKEFASHTYTDETTTVHGGSHAQKITAASSTQHLGVRQSVSLGVGKLHRFSAWVYSSAGDQVIFNVGSTVFTQNTLPNTWTQISGYVNALSAVRIRIYVTATNVTNGDVLIVDDVVVDEITNIPSNEGFKIYSTMTGGVNQLSVKDVAFDQNTTTESSVFKSNLQVQDGLTLEAWVYPTTDVGDKIIAGTWSNNHGYQLYRSDQKFYAKIDGTVIDNLASNMPANNWYHVAFVTDETTEKIYVNGNLYVSESNGTDLPSLADRFVIGANSLNYLNSFSGQIDEIRVSSSARSNDYVSASYLSQNSQMLTFGTEEIQAIQSTPSPVPLTQSSPAKCNLASPLLAPWLHSATQIDKDTVRLSFLNNDVSSNSFVVEYGTETGSYKFSTPSFGDKNTSYYDVSSLEPSVKYYFRIRANNDCATGPWSNVINVRTSSVTEIGKLVIVDSDIKTDEPESADKLEVAAQKGYDLKILVVNKDKEKVKGAKVTLHSKVQEGVTDDNGEISFTNVEQGEHTLDISYSGFKGQQKLFIDGDNTKIELTVTVEKSDSYYLKIIVALGIIILILLTVVFKKKSKVI